MSYILYVMTIFLFLVVKNIFVNRLLPREPVDEDDKPYYARYNQHLCEESKPGKVESNLDSVIFSDGIQRLELVPVSKPAPALVQLTSVRL